MLKMRNSTDFSDAFLRRMVSWCCKEVGLKPSKIRRAQFTFCSRTFRGRAWWSMRFLVRIHRPDGGRDYPFTSKYPGRVNAISFELRDRIESLVHVTAHEVFHLAQFSEGIRKVREAAVDAIAIKALESFRVRREELLSEWSESPPASENPKKDLTQARAAKAQSGLDRWQRKLKLAQTKIRKYKRQVRYYEKRQAAKKFEA